MLITLKQLQVFLQVSKLGNMTQASEMLHLSQSACSMALSALEAQLGAPLFDRRGKKLILNERGKLLFPKASNIISQVSEIEDALISKTKLSGNLIIGASTTIGNYLLPSIIGEFARLYPDVRIKLRVGDTDQIVKYLLKFNIDIGIVEVPCNADDIDVLPWREDELIIIAHPKHPLTKKAKITRKDLREAQWILRESTSVTRKEFEATMGSKIIPFIELGHSEAIKKAVEKGLGIGCVSKTTVTELMKSGKIVQLHAPFLKLTRRFSILIHKEKYKTALINQFIQFAIEEK